MYTTLPTFVLGFHGCDRSVVDRIASGHDYLRSSENDYDWLGNGTYFWENDPDRALEFAEMLHSHPRRARRIIAQPAVIGAVIDLGHCLNLMESAALESVRSAYETLRVTVESAGIELPVNSPGLGGSNDLLLRRLDCAVIQLLHQENAGRQFDTVRGLFFEGEDLYPNAGFRTKNHIQICVRNPNCIKGYFHPRTPDVSYPVP